MTADFHQNADMAPKTLNLGDLKEAYDIMPGTDKTYGYVAASVFMTKHQAFLDKQKKLEAEKKQTLKLVLDEEPTEPQNKPYVFAFTG